MTRRELTSATIRGEIINAMRLGILLTTKVGEKENSMTIGWGTLGGIWEKRVFSRTCAGSVLPERCLTSAGSLPSTYP